MRVKAGCSPVAQKSSRGHKRSAIEPRSQITSEEVLYQDTLEVGPTT